jgi:hypothetical protein
MMCSSMLRGWIVLVLACVLIPMRRAHADIVYTKVSAIGSAGDIYGQVDAARRFNLNDQGSSYSRVDGDVSTAYQRAYVGAGVSLHVDGGGLTFGSGFPLQSVPEPSRMVLCGTACLVFAALGAIRCFR